MAEGATHVDIFHDIRKPAFTLAEVLVTLGIIGVVAAMTLPMLARNYNFYIRQQQFKKAYAALEIATQKTQIDMGENLRCFYLNGKYNADNLIDCDYFYSELAKALHTTRVCKNNALKNKCIPTNFRGGEIVIKENENNANANQFKSSCRGFTDDYIKKKATVFMLNSGIYLIPYYSGTKGRENIAVFLFDINGFSGPNKWGHDIFVLNFHKSKTKDSVFKLDYSIFCHPLDKDGYYTNTFMEYLYGRSTELH